MLEQMLEKLDPRQQRLLVGGGLAMLVALLFSYVLVPQMKLYTQGLESKSVLEAAARQGQEVSLQLENLRADVEDLKRQLHGDMANLAEQQLEAFVIGRLQGISWRNNVELLSIEPATGEAVQMFNESLFKVALSGDYRDLYAWLGNINEELGFVVIKEYEMQPVEDIPADPRLEVGLTIASYRVAGS